MVPALEVPKGRNEAMFMSKKIYVPDLPINNRPLSLSLSDSKSLALVSQKKVKASFSLRPPDPQQQRKCRID